MKSIKLSLLLFVFLIASICSGSQVNSQISKDVKRKLEEKVPIWLSENNVPAVGIGIIENGKIEYAKVFGELQKGVPAPDNTIFNVASITKTVVTMLTLKLVETGQWDLDEPLSDYWVDPDVASDSLHTRLTSRHVLTHQTGFANWRSDNPDNSTFQHSET